MSVAAGARGRRAWLVPAAGFSVMAATVAVGLWYALGLDRDIGMPYPPFIGRWDPSILVGWAVTAAVLLALAVWLAPRLLTLPAVAFAAALYVTTLALRLALGAASSGTSGWSRMFDVNGFEGPNEYLPALTAFRYGPGFFLDRFAELVPALPVHAAGHPPGLLLVMDRLSIDTPGELAALIIGVGALAAPLAYALGRALGPERTARIAGLLTALAPSVLIYGATSADALFAVLGLLAAWPLTSARLAPRLLGAVLLAVGSLFAWSLLGIGAWAAVLAWRRNGWRDMLVLGLLCGAVLLAVHGGFAALTGFDAIGTLRATEAVYRFGIADERPYWFWLTGSPTAFLLMLGLPVAWYGLRALGAGEDTAVAIVAVIAVAAVAGFTKAEVERIWLFLAPLVCLAAATALPERRLRPMLALLAVHALAWELAWNTVW